MDGTGYAQAVRAARAEFSGGGVGIMRAAAGVAFEVTGPGRIFQVPMMDSVVLVTYPDGAVFCGGQEAGVDVTIVVLHYLCRSAGPLDLRDPVRYGRLHHAAPFSAAFRERTEVPLMERFGDDGEGFMRAIRRAGGRPLDIGPPHGTHHPAQAADPPSAFAPVAPPPDPTILWDVPFLPHLPLGVRLGLAEDGLPADCVLLFPRRAGFFYDAEDLAVCGQLLAARLLEPAGR